MIRVLHVLTCMDRAGQETLIMNLYRNIDRAKIQFDFLCTSSKKGDYDDEIISLGGTIHHLPESRIKIPHLHNIGIILNYRSFFKKHPEYRIVHFHNYHAFSTLVQILGAKLGKVKSIFIHSHNTNAPNPIVHKLAKPLLKIFSINRLACSNIAGKWMFGNSKFIVLKNGIRISDYSFDQNARISLRNQLGISTTTKLICHIGRFNFQKNHEFILKIFYELLQTEKNYKLILLGKGELEEKIRRISQEMKIDDCIIFAGIREDVHKLLSASDLFFFPSLFEGLGIVMIEAQANGLPIVCSDTIPDEALICKNINKISLDEDLKIWTNSLIEQCKKGHENINIQLVKEAGYDIDENARVLVKMYENV